MATNYPGALDDFENPDGNDSMAGKEGDVVLHPGLKHSRQHTDINDAVEAMEAYVGIENSVDPDSLTYKIDIMGGVSQAYVDAAIANLIDTAPGTLDTLNELAAALGDDANFAATVTTSLSNKVSIVGINAATTTDVLSSKVTGDANNRFVLNTDGSQEWGSGTGATDTILSRSTTNSMTLTGVLTVQRTGSTNNSFGGQVIGEAVTRWLMRSDGQLSWGDGTNAKDTNLYRSAAGVLLSDHNIRATLNMEARTGAATRTAIGNIGPGSEAAISFGTSLDATIYRTGAAAIRTNSALTVDGISALTGAVTGGASISATGNLAAKSGAATQVNLGNVGPTAEAAISIGLTTPGVLYRDAATSLRTTGGFTVDGSLVISTNLTMTAGTILVTRSAVGTGAIRTRVTGDSQDRIDIVAGGDIQWGSGAATFDTSIGRTGVGILGLTGGLTVSTTLGVTGAITATAGILVGASGGVAVTRAASSLAFTAQVTADGTQRWAVFVDGKIEWGDGTATRDTVLARSGAGVLALTTGSYTVVGDISARLAAATQVKIGAFGPGSESAIVFGSAVDAKIYRTGATALRTDSALTVDGALTASNGITVTGSLTSRITPRVTSISSSATPTINTNNCDAVTITALATNITSMTTNLTGAPVNFDKLLFRIKDDGTSRTITWGASFEAKGVPLPTATVISKVLTVGFLYDSVSLKWGCIASTVEA